MRFRLFRGSDGNHWDVEVPSEDRDEARQQALEAFGQRLGLQLSYLGTNTDKPQFSMGPIDGPATTAVWVRHVGAQPRE